MIKLKNIFFPTDFSDNANQALRYAALFADKFDSELTLFHVIALFQDDPNNPEHHFPNHRDFYDTMEQHALTNMSEVDM